MECALVERPELKTSKFDYKWVIAGACMLMIFVAMGFCSSPKGLFIAKITEVLDIKRSLFSINDSCRFVATAIMNLFFGTMVMRFGTRKLIGVGFIFLILSCLVYSVAESIYVFYLGGIFLGIGYSWTSTTMVGCVVNKWCKENKGTIMGVVLAVNGLGGALATQIISPIIYQEGNPFGYRSAYRLIALIVLITGIIVVSLIRESPKGILDSKAAPSKKKSRSKGWVGLEYSVLTKKAYFYGALICVFFTGMCLQGIAGVSAAHMKDSGLDASYVATVVSFHALSLTASKLLIGFMYDKLGLKITSNSCSITAAIVMAMLALVTNSPSGKILAMIYGIFSSFAMPLETIMLPIYVGDLFGQKSFDKALGIFMAVNVAGYAVGTPIVNFSFDLLGSYRPALFASCAIMVLVTIGMRIIIKAAKREQMAVLEEESKAVAEIA